VLLLSRRDYSGAGEILTARARAAFPRRARRWHDSATVELAGRRRGL